ncbi:P-loop containing nucleoside triphosphate hydrolase protein [Podospora australis]|uniref:DNA 3'-5' helicase n=1 Tax=Podospora australis TaxID=1536484 RepID=A0AAN7AFC4_9PEZI|nr:P-loop containing nucleoside triphosphate hydrolase protein [Podospora australis]
MGSAPKCQRSESGDEFASRDELFEDFEFGDDPFDDIDEAGLAELEQPAAKRPKLSQENHLSLAQRLLADKFGYESFRHEQAGAIQSLLAGDNALAIFPTGAGKSLCYQIPAIAFPELDKSEGSRTPAQAGITLVVSPLIALMKDQVDALQKRGIAADSIDSSKRLDEINTIYHAIQTSELRILYCAPEKLNNEVFVNSIKGVPGGIRLLAVDEAHCVSEWGHSFRPDYLKVARFFEEIKAERVICLTATATPKVADDICNSFKIKPQCVFKTPSYRPNLELYAKPMTGYSDASVDALFSLLGPTLVYVALQQQAETHAEVLCKQGFNAAAYHGGMNADIKKDIQGRFMAGNIQIICATIAFGMGIDKPDIRNVVHWDLSNSVEEYSQQVGRAGRDGKISRCMFYLAPSAFYLREVFARGDLPSRRSLEELISAIHGLAGGLPPGGVFKVSHHEQSRQFDIRPTTLGVIYATLELHFGLFRATAAEYTTYKFEAMSSYKHTAQNDKSPEAEAIWKNAKKKLKYHDINVNAAAGRTLNRTDIIKKLGQWDQAGHIRLQTSGVVNCYTIVKKSPATEKQQQALVDELHADLQGRERDAVTRSRQVMDLITGSACFARSLAEHFGMSLPGGKDKCGHCTFCQTGRPVVAPRIPITKTTRASIQGVLSATNVRDDPRFLAKVAYGIRSPRITQLKLDRHGAFRSLADHDFDALLREFTKACETKGRR